MNTTVETKTTCDRCDGAITEPTILGVGLVYRERPRLTMPFGGPNWRTDRHPARVGQFVVLCRACFDIVAPPIFDALAAAPAATDTETLVD
jgi:hypothetical protein